MMIPFMGAQSLVLGKAFGEGFQYGKRRISALPNEEFNKLTPSDIAVNSRKELSEMIPSLQASIGDMRQFQTFIVKELIETVKQLPGDVFSGVTGQGKGTPAGDAFDLTASAFGLPKAFAEEDTGTTKFVSDYITEAKNLPFDLLAGIVEKMLSGKLQQPIERMIAYKQVYKDIISRKPVPKSVPDAIKASGATGLVLQIAQAWKNMLSFLNGLRVRSKTKILKPSLYNAVLKQFLNEAKKYNQLVALNRQPNLQIDTAKSILAFKLIPKT